MRYRDAGILGLPRDAGMLTDSYHTGFKKAGRGAVDLGTGKSHGGYYAKLDSGPIGAIQMGSSATGMIPEIQVSDLKIGLD